MLLTVFLTVHTAGPAAGSAHTFSKLRVSPLDSTFPGFDKLCALNPANPFIARQWCDVMPCHECLLVSCKGPS